MDIEAAALPGRGGVLTDVRVGNRHAARVVAADAAAAAVERAVLLNQRTAADGQRSERLDAAAVAKRDVADDRRAIEVQHAAVVDPAAERTFGWRPRRGA